MKTAEEGSRRAEGIMIQGTNALQGKRLVFWGLEAEGTLGETAKSSLGKCLATLYCPNIAAKTEIVYQASPRVQCGWLRKFHA